jgi:hypothetical protein
MPRPGVPHLEILSASACRSAVCSNSAPASLCDPSGALWICFESREELDYQMLFDPCPLPAASVLCALSRSFPWPAGAPILGTFALRITQACALALHQADTERPSWLVSLLKVPQACALCDSDRYCNEMASSIKARSLMAAGHSLRYASSGWRRSPSISLVLFWAVLTHRTRREWTSLSTRLADDEDRCTLRSDHRWLPYRAAPALLMTIAPSASRRKEPLWTCKSMHRQDSIPKTLSQASAAHRANSKPRVVLRPFVPLHLLGGPPF